MDIENAKIAILATDGYEKSELFEPRRQLADAGAEVTIVSTEGGEIQSWDETDWGESVPVDATLGRVSVDDFDALVLPGGQINPDVLRTKPEAVAFIRDFAASGKIVAAICHAPWLLIEAGVVKGRAVTSYNSIKTDVENAGGRWRDEAPVVDGNLITARNPGDLDGFCEQIVESLRAQDARAAA